MSIVPSLTNARAVDATGAVAPEVSRHGRPARGPAENAKNAENQESPEKYAPDARLHVRAINCRKCRKSPPDDSVAVILSEAKDLMLVASGDEILRYAQDDTKGE
jgi:hypothetical protein